MATIGEVKWGKKDSKLDFKDLQLSTCKIKKAGIGGPLINFDGSLVGMNFYDGSGVTPFLPRREIVEILNRVNCLPSERYHFLLCRIVTSRCSGVVVEERDVAGEQDAVRGHGHSLARADWSGARTEDQPGDSSNCSSPEAVNKIRKQIADHIDLWLYQNAKTKDTRSHC